MDIELLVAHFAWFLESVDTAADFEDLCEIANRISQ